MANYEYLYIKYIARRKLFEGFLIPLKYEHEVY